MNPGPDGADRPVTVTVMQLKSAGAFDSADFFALQNPSAALGGDLLRSDQIVVAPGGAASKVLTIEAGATVIGVIAGFRTPAGKQFRSKIAAPGSNSGLIISVGPSGLSLQAA
jgi:type VI secretion system protein VasD